MHLIIVLHLPVFIIVKDFLSRWYVIYSGWYLPNVDLQQCGLRTTGSKVFPAFAKLYFWQWWSDRKTCRESVLGLVRLEVMICGTDLTAVLLFSFLVCTSMLISLVLHGILTYTYVFNFSGSFRVQMHWTCCMEHDPAFVCLLSVSWRLWMHCRSLISLRHFWKYLWKSPLRGFYGILCVTVQRINKL